MRARVFWLTALLFVAGCSTRGGATGGTVAPTAPPRHYVVATGSNDLVLRVNEGGGLVPESYLVTTLPRFALYGDGRVIVPAPVREIFPGPLLPDIRQLQLTGADVQKILAAADEAGLLGSDARFDATGIADAGTTRFTTTVGGVTHTISAYALYEGMTTESEAVAAARAKLMLFRGLILDLPRFLGRPIADTEFTPSAMRVFFREATSNDSSGVTRSEVTWPRAIDPPALGSPSVAGYRCFELTGGELSTFLTVARTVDMQTIWIAASGRYSVAVRPLYPDESGCPVA